MLTLQFNDPVFVAYLPVRLMVEGVSPPYSIRQAIRGLVRLTRYALRKSVFKEVQAVMELEG